MTRHPRIISGQEAAEYLGYSSVNNAFNKYCRELGIKRTRRGRFDLRQIDAALDADAGIVQDNYESAEDKAVREFFANDVQG